MMENDPESGKMRESDALIAAKPSRCARISAYATIAMMGAVMCGYGIYHLGAPKPIGGLNTLTMSEPIAENKPTLTNSMVEKYTCSPISSGMHEVQVGSKTRNFEVYHPSELPGNQKIPLVFVIHGISSSPNDIEEKVKMKAQAEKEKWLVVYPVAAGSFKSYNGLGCCGDTQDDVAMIKTVIDYMGTNSCADVHNVFFTGFSNGGFMSHRLGCEMGMRSDGYPYLRAIAPHSGLIGSYTTTPYQCKPGRPIPILSFHGTADAVVGYNGNNPNPFSKAIWNSFENTMNIWATNNCGSSYTTTTTKPTPSSTCVSADGCDVEFCSIEGLAHTWSGDDPNRNDYAATPAIVAFFKKHMVHED